MAEFTLSYSGTQINNLLGAVNTAVNGDGIVSTNALNTILENYLTQTNASGIYLSQSDASSTYLTQSDASNTYLTQSNASSTYLTQTNASNTYLAKSAFITTEITTFNKSITVTTSWTNTGIVSTDLPSGIYIVIVDNFPNGYVGQWSETYAGLVVWHNGGTNSSDPTEIPLHNNGHATNSQRIYLRTMPTANTDGHIYLQIKSSTSASTSATLRFRFKRLV